MISTLPAVSPTDLCVDRDQVTAEICRQSFFEFVKRHWHLAVSADPVWNWHIKYMCEELQLVAERIFKNEPKEYDLLINVPPGSTKSTIVSIMFPAWCWTRMEKMRVIGSSHTHDLALDLARKNRGIVKSKQYTDLFNIHLKDDQDTKTYFENEAGGDRHAVGLEGSIMGFHGHLILIDDPVNPKGARSEAEIKAANISINEGLLTRKVDKRVTVVVMVMQRLSETDPSSEMLLRATADPHSKVKHICLPADLETGRSFVKPERLVYKYKDGLLDPVRMPKTILKAERKRLGEYGYAGQFDQNPVPVEGGMFKVDRIKTGTPPPRMKFYRLCRYWDKAGSDPSDGGAYTVGALLGIFHVVDGAGKVVEQNIWILDINRFQAESAERERRIRQTAEQDGKGVFIGTEQEPGSGGKESAQATVRNTLMGYSVVKDKVTGDKVTRADPFSVQVNEGNVYMPPGAPWWVDFRAELQLFPFGKRKDQVDACSGAFAMLTNRIRLGALGR